TVEDFSAIPEEPESGETDVPQFETFAVVEDDDQAGQVAPLVTDEFETNAASTFSDPTASFADLNEDESFATSATDFQEVDFNIVTTPETPVAAVDEDADEGRHENI